MYFVIIFLTKIFSYFSFIFPKNKQFIIDLVINEMVTSNYFDLSDY